MTTTQTITQTAKNLTYRRFAMPGMIFNIRLSSAETNGKIVIADFEGIPGCEPPRHLHTREDEIFMITEGEITFFIGDDIVQATNGDTVFLPKNVPHHFVITSDVLKAVVMATPGRIEHFFRSLSFPYDGEEIPVPEIPTQKEVDHFVNQTHAYGMEFV